MTKCDTANKNSKLGQVDSRMGLRGSVKYL